MKNIYYLLILFCFGANAQIINFPDPNLKAKLLYATPGRQIAKNFAGNWIKIDVNNNGEIEVNEAQQVFYLNINPIHPFLPSFAPIFNLEGLSNFINLTYLNCGNNQIQNLDLSYFPNLQTLSCYRNLINSIDLSYSNNLEILSCDNNQLTSLSINNLNNLSQLSCGQNQISALDLSNSGNLIYLNCNNNQLTLLNVDNLIHLKDFSCGFNQIASLDVSNLILLESFACHNNQIITLDVSSLINLMSFFCENNQITSIDVSSLVNLTEMGCGNNLFTTLQVAGLNNLTSLQCDGNQLTSLDVSECPVLVDFHIANSPLLKSVFMKNGSNQFIYDYTGLPSLEFICADEFEIQEIQTQISNFNYVNCHVNSYCSFSPGGVFYTMQGNVKFDTNNNGCDVSDFSLPNLKFNITNGTISGSLISHASGNYSIPVQTGTHTITPIFENPSYFNAFPASVTVNFPAQASPFAQSFCVTPNGSHPDLEVVLVPLNPARPGFDVRYKLIYKNKGNITQSGAVSLTFDDVILDFISANPAVSNQTVNNLSWNFTNLAPFETREITLTLNVNSPMETPAVNNGDILDYTTTISSSAIDEMPNDNTFVFNQTVVNSYDPNDKTCLEGNSIASDKVGEYVHYMIRFENTGTFPAENIVVKDMIDTTKFDINSIVSMKGSHSFITNITSGNKVEFIFENINLPFDDANNDGYVLFKIKTKPTLTNGDTFSNTANIYFDYNFPIVTNTATTTISVLAVQNFEFSNYFIIYPNPVHDVLNISTKEPIEVSSVSVYNTLGQLVLLVPNAQNVKMVDVSNLVSGNYFIKINSDKGVSNTKFIKN